MTIARLSNSKVGECRSSAYGAQQHFLRQADIGADRDRLEVEQPGIHPDPRAVADRQLPRPMDPYSVANQHIVADLRAESSQDSHPDRCGAVDAPDKEAVCHDPSDQPEPVSALVVPSAGKSREIASALRFLFRMCSHCDTKTTDPSKTVSMIIADPTVYTDAHCDGAWMSAESVADTSNDPSSHVRPKFSVSGPPIAACERLGPRPVHRQEPRTLDCPQSTPCHLSLPLTGPNDSQEPASSALRSVSSDVLELVPDVLEAPTPSQLRRQRLLDLCVVVPALIVGLIPSLLIAAMVRVSSKGPALFVQDRVGLHGRTFRMVKFRTMRDGTHLEVRASHETMTEFHENDFKLSPDDPRITKVGRWLRKTSLDELPQLFNVLRGDMSIVGVRPVEPEQLASWPADQQALYVMHRPGLTGLWQINGRSTVLKEERLELDRRYLENWSVWGDMKILARTPGAVLRIHHTH